MPEFGDASGGWSQVELAAAQSPPTRIRDAAHDFDSLSPVSAVTDRCPSIDVAEVDEAIDEATDEELAAFLAADLEPVEADPDFKRKLRDQLWTLIQGQEMTRQ